MISKQYGRFKVFVFLTFIFQMVKERWHHLSCIYVTSGKQNIQCRTQRWVQEIELRDNMKPIHTFLYFTTFLFCPHSPTKLGN